MCPRKPEPMLPFIPRDRPAFYVSPPIRTIAVSSQSVTPRIWRSPNSNLSILGGPVRRKRKQWRAQAVIALAALLSIGGAIAVMRSFGGDPPSQTSIQQLKHGG